MVGAREQLIEVLRETAGAAIFADDREVRGDLTIEQPELLQLRSRERSESAPGNLVEQLLEPSPVGFAFVQPARGDHGWNRMNG